MKNIVNFVQHACIQCIKGLLNELWIYTVLIHLQFELKGKLGKKVVKIGYKFKDLIISLKIKIVQQMSRMVYKLIKENVN